MRVGFASLSGCSIALVPSRMGIMEAEHVDLKIRKAKEGNSHYPKWKPSCLENTSNRGGNLLQTERNRFNYKSFEGSDVMFTWTVLDYLMHLFPRE